MTALRMAIVAALALATVAPAVAQSSTSSSTRHVRRLVVGHPDPNQPTGGSPGYQANTYGRRPSSRTPTDVGNMQFPDPSDTPAGRLPSVSVAR